MATRIISPKDPSIDLIRILSEGTYTSFPQALKEFISNSHDAYATEVELRFDDDFNSLFIRDNGEGMTAEDFINTFASIARSGKSNPPSKELNNLKRTKIGRFGIGALAVVGAAERFSITSVKKGSTNGFEASIDLAELKTHYQKGEDLKDVWKFALAEWQNEKKATHFTEIKVEGIRADIREKLSRSGKTLSDFFESIDELSGLDELRWQLGVICPVQYSHGYPIPKEDIDSKKDAMLIETFRSLSKNNFQISLNNHPIENPAYIPAYDPEKISRGAERNLLLRRGVGYDVRYIKSPENSKVTYKGYLAAQAYQIFPTQLRGVLIRLRGVAVGWHRTLNLGATASTMLSSMSGEVWVDGLDEALQFDRESFREDHPLFSWLRDQIQQAVDDETAAFRSRSARRMTIVKRTRHSGKKVSQKKQNKAQKASARQRDAYLSSEIFDKMPEYLTRLLPQLNGTYDFEWNEGCAMVLRRLMETLIIELYARRGWEKDIQDTSTNEFLMLKGLIDKLNGDARLNMQRRTIEGLNKVKELGDTAAHDFRVRIRKSDLDKIATAVRLTCERLIFKIKETAPNI